MTINTEDRELLACLNDPGPILRHHQYWDLLSLANRILAAHDEAVADRKKWLQSLAGEPEYQDKTLKEIVEGI